MIENDEETIKKKILIFFELKSLVHLKLKSEEFRNGRITKVLENHILLEERKLGLIPIFFNEIYHVDPMILREGVE